MKAMILAAGFGDRMGKLSKTIPKPLLQIDGQALIEYHLYALAKAGFKEVVINVSHLGELIKKTLGHGEKYNLSIYYSDEEKPLGPGGGIRKALPLLGDDPFLVVSADVQTDYPLEQLHQKKLETLGHLVLVDNPDNHQKGDFSLKNGLVFESQPTNYTYSGIGILHPKLFEGIDIAYHSLTTILQPAMLEEKISGEHYAGRWLNINTPEALSSSQ